MSTWLVTCRRRDHRVIFCWVPEHVSIEGSKRPDEVAKAATHRSAPEYSLPYKDLYLSTRSRVQTVWQGRWEGLMAANKMDEITSRIYCPWTYAQVRGRHLESALARLRTDHTDLSHGYLMPQRVQPLCDNCLVPQTMRHLFT